MTSDHHPLLLTGLCTERTPPKQGFRFLDAWFQHPYFFDTVERLWQRDLGHIGSCLEHLRQGLQDWNKNVFRNIFHRKRRWVARLGGVQTRLSIAPTPFLVKLEHKLATELHNILLQEESYWKQAS